MVEIQPAAGAKLIGAELSKVNLFQANMQGTQLRAAKFLWANLTGVNLRDANLSGANLTGATFIDADLSGADLTNANLQFARLIDSKPRRSQSHRLPRLRSLRLEPQLHRNRRVRPCHHTRETRCRSRSITSKSRSSSTCCSTTPASASASTRLPQRWCSFSVDSPPTGFQFCTAYARPLAAAATYLSFSTSEADPAATSPRPSAPSPIWPASSSPTSPTRAASRRNSPPSCPICRQCRCSPCSSPHSANTACSSTSSATPGCSTRFSTRIPSNLLEILPEAVIRRAEAIIDAQVAARA